MRGSLRSAPALTYKGRNVRPELRVLGLVCGLVACTAHDHGDHEHDPDGGDDHHEVRDPAIEPCDASNWQALYPDLRQCTLDGEILAGATLRRADLTASTLVTANLAGADLFTAVLVDADLRGADLARAKLTSARLAGADLTGARLVGAVLINADLTGATLTGAITDDTTTCPSGTAGPCW